MADNDSPADVQWAATPEIRAIQAHVRSRVVRLVDFTDRSQGGTAVKVQIGRRFFLATAAHVIPDGL